MAVPVPAPLRFEDPTERPPYIKGLIIGPSGVGKTWQLCTPSRLYKTLLLLVETEVSRATIVGYFRRHGHKPDVVHIESAAEASAVCDYLFGGQHEYRCVGLDGVTDIQKRELSTQARGRYASDQLGDPYNVSPGTWNRTQSSLDDLISDFRNLPLHFFVTALPEEVKYLKGGMPLWGPLVRPKGFQHSLPRLFNLVGHLEKELVYDEAGAEHTVRRLIVGGRGSHITKDLGGLLIPEIDNPDLAEIIQMFETEGGDE